MVNTSCRLSICLLGIGIIGYQWGLRVSCFGCLALPQPLDIVERVFHSFPLADALRWHFNKPSWSTTVSQCCSQCCLLLSLKTSLFHAFLRSQSCGCWQGRMTWSLLQFYHPNWSQGRCHRGLWRGFHLIKAASAHFKKRLFSWWQIICFEKGALLVRWR